MRPVPNELLDALLASHEVRADGDRTIERVRALSLEPRADVQHKPAALHEVGPDRAEFVVALWPAD